MKVSKEYEEAVVDVIYIINNMVEEEKNKIPKSLVDLFLNITKSSNYISNINIEIPLYEQELKPKTKALLGLLYRQFLCSDSEREIFDKKLTV